MAITLGTNIPSFNSRISLNQLTDKLTKTMEKLSSGLKINRAGDNASGLVISENMKALIRGSKQAQANIDTATSFLTIAEDGMVSIGDHLQRINDLLVDMANDTNDLNSRDASAREIVERLSEVDRLAECTNYNGRTMLDGTATEIFVQMGPDETANSVIEISSALSDCRAKALGVTLPGYLNPEAKKDADGKIYIPTKELQADGSYKTVYYEEGTTNTIDKVAFDALTESAFNPTNKNCREYMANVQKAISINSTRRGLLGAYENRMQSSYDAITTRIESLEAAKSVYTDTDIAEEATNLSTQQIMQQYNVAILASANTLPQLALSLLSM
ncbi:MAG: flagellin [Candidatus Gastranaerophilales bacterium]|nr:flagellin [Candidatus Gastranaerophilales bacterium]